MCVNTHDKGEKSCFERWHSVTCLKSLLKNTCKTPAQKKTRGIADEPSKKYNQDIAKEVKQVASETAEGKRCSGSGEEAQGTGSKEAGNKRSGETGRLISGCPG